MTGSEDPLQITMKGRKRRKDGAFCETNWLRQLLAIFLEEILDINARRFYDRDVSR